MMAAMNITAVKVWCLMKDYEPKCAVNIGGIDSVLAFSELVDGMTFDKVRRLSRRPSDAEAENMISFQFQMDHLVVNYSHALATVMVDFSDEDLNAEAVHFHFRDLGPFPISS
jgi:hypothetical protein